MYRERPEKSIAYLIEHKWIEFLGKKDVATRGGVQPVSEYKINNLWKMNVDFYENKGGSPQEHKKNHIQEEPSIKEEPTFLSEFENVLLKENELDKLKIKFGEKNAFILIEE